MGGLRRPTVFLRVRKVKGACPQRRARNRAGIMPGVPPLRTRESGPAVTEKRKWAMKHKVRWRIMDTTATIIAT
jgi:hypothetical protein